MRSAVAFLTSVGGSREPDSRTLDWFPAVGAALGAVLGGLWWASARAWPAGVAAALVVAADLALTGMLHFDGLVDSADGLLPPMTRKRRLEVMASPETGAFAVGAGAVVLLLRWTALSGLRADVLLLASLWCLSRTGIAAAARFVKYARGDTGLATAFSGPARYWTLGVGVAGSFALAAAWRPLAGVVAVLSAMAAGGSVIWLGVRRVGGYTGDVLGASAVIAETAGLVVAAAKW
jgi:adenosylcobinamide-GDP ribazoletransferase